MRETYIQMSKYIRYILFAVALLTGAAMVCAQEPVAEQISLEEVRSAAESHFPLLRQR